MLWFALCCILFSWQMSLSLASRQSFLDRAGLESRKGNASSRALIWGVVGVCTPKHPLLLHIAEHVWFMLRVLGTKWLEKPTILQGSGIFTPGQLMKMEHTGLTAAMWTSWASPWAPMRLGEWGRFKNRRMWCQDTITGGEGQGYSKGSIRPFYQYLPHCHPFVSIHLLLFSCLDLLLWWDHNWE